ncbi:DNA cytosine methyltransferase [Ottowia sp.]|uniref:DNA cytosine methyltransferase n=1 Tax=Ottowia sp. TaxID=1898956 RepID=UPI003A8AFF23
MLGEGARAALELFGRRLNTVCYVEREAAAASQLARLMEAGAIAPCPIWSDLLTFDGAAWRGCVDFIIAGFPCQDLSIAGKRAGLDGARSGLFFNILDIADACSASGIILENVNAIATATATVVDKAEGELQERAAARVVGELADRGWDAEWITISAAAVGASHIRKRWFCFAWRRVGHTGLQYQHLQQRPDGAEFEAADGDVADAERTRRSRPGGGSVIDTRRQPEPGCGAVADASEPGLQGGQLSQARDGGGHRCKAHGSAAEFCAAPLFAPGPLDQRWARIVTDHPHLEPATEPGVYMLVDGVAYVVDESRTDRLREAGNGVVPLQAAVAIATLMRRAGGLT